MRTLNYCLILLFTAVSFLSTSVVLAQTNTVTYQKNTEHELTIYFINGKESGTTMMIIGGIQGDEPGGYLAADLYADMLLEKGNLIVVPRANFNSIIRNMRGVNGDMNRKFSSNENEKYDRDDDIVEVLQNLIMKSDVLLNLHDGSGFYHPEYISDMKNPMRYGQSIIADASFYKKENGDIIDLEGHAKRIIESVNRNIKNPEHHFKFNNHDTISENTKHEEQRKSATFFALTESEIPAFGIETSKNIPQAETKVRYQSLVINTFMAEYGIIPEHPSVYLPAPELDHLVINIVGYQNPFALKNNGTLSIPAGTSIHVSSVVANYKRGLSIDILNVGGTNDLGRVTVINFPTTIKVFKDAYPCGEVKIETTSEKLTEIIPEVKISSVERLKNIEFEVDGKNIVVSEDDTLHIVRGDEIKVVDALIKNMSASGFRINFVGFVGNKKFNDAEDRGYIIDTARDLMSSRSLDNNNSLYEIQVDNLKTKNKIGSVYIILDEPKIDYLIVQSADGTSFALTPGSTVDCKKLDRFTILTVISNVTSEPPIETYIENGSEQIKKLNLPELIEVNSNTEINFMRSSSNIGSITFRTSG
ncbi:M14/M99 family metallopeptidase [Candidatus Latescibacterota bacterium]